ncbi:MAG: phytanoyl-CoA dioxygenase family protein [Chloroflexi bacterium]|nr:phytanoyl-CoA dioxygenase family protein [Chloroflexota bacterium]
MSIASPVQVDIDRFNTEGYVVIEDVLDPVSDLDPVMAEYMDLLEHLVAQWRAEGTLSTDYADLPFPQRWGHVLQEVGAAGYQPFDISLPFSGVTADTPIHLGPATFRLLANPRLLDAVEQIVGSEILSNPIQHVRIKPPERLLPESLKRSLAGGTGWHQDQGVALPEIDETEMLTVWLPVTDATIENGCLCVVPRSHQQGLVTHCPGDGVRQIGLEIPEEIRGTNFMPIPMRRGSALFIHRQVMHAALTNVSDGIRWSFDLRYQPIGQPTGRPWFPAWVARSRANPTSEVHDPAVWRDLWLAARSNLTANPPQGKFNRWEGDEPICA